MAHELTALLADMKEKEAFAFVEKALKEGIDPMSLLDDAREGMNLVGERFAEGTYFIPELIFSGDILKNIVKLLEPHLTKTDKDKPALGKVVIGTVAGDIHDIGKDLVVFMLEVSGFEVTDLGVDVPPQKFVDAVKETGSTVVGLSGFLTLAFETMKATVEAFTAANLREKVKIMIGGGQIDDYVKKFTGADAAGKDAMEAVKLAKSWIGG
jgi:5-methyltetrahydrofolate--homocysteine methyltransferase